MQIEKLSNVRISRRLLPALIIAVVVALAAAAMMHPATDTEAATSIIFLDVNGDPVNTDVIGVTNVIELTGAGSFYGASPTYILDDRTSSWFIVKNNIDLGSGSAILIPSGTVNLIIGAGCTLTTGTGFGVNSGSVLNLYTEKPGASTIPYGKFVSTGGNGITYFAGGTTNNTATIEVSGIGVTAPSGLTFNNGVTGKITGGSSGMKLEGGGTVNNYGEITGPVGVSFSTTPAVMNNMLGGTIMATIDGGVDFRDGGALYNFGIIKAGNNRAVLAAKSATIENEGDGVTGGLIEGGLSGIWFGEFSGAGGAGDTISNKGVIRGVSGSAAAISFQSGTDILVTNHEEGKIIADNNGWGISFSGGDIPAPTGVLTGEIRNYGLIRGSAYGIDAKHSATIVNEGDGVDTGIIEGAVGVRINNFNGSAGDHFTNCGLIKGNSGEGVQILNGNNITISNIISGAKTGKITGFSAGYGSAYGISLSVNGKVWNQGWIEGGTYGIYAARSATVYNEGTIIGGTTGVAILDFSGISAAGDIFENKGSIIGTGLNGVQIGNGTDILIVNSADGIITGASRGISLGSATVTGMIENYGWIESTATGSGAPGLAGIVAYASATILNDGDGVTTGVIKGPAGVQIDNMATTDEIVNYGLIQGTVGDGIVVNLGTSISITNGINGLNIGTITGVSGGFSISCGKVIFVNLGTVNGRAMLGSIPGEVTFGAGSSITGDFFCYIGSTITFTGTPTGSPLKYATVGGIASINLSQVEIQGLPAAYTGGVLILIDADTGSVAGVPSNTTYTTTVPALTFTIKATSKALVAATVSSVQYTDEEGFTMTHNAVNIDQAYFGAAGAAGVLNDYPGLTGTDGTWYYVTENISLSELVVTGDVGIIIKDGCTLAVTGTSGSDTDGHVNVASGKRLGLYSQPFANTGRVTSATTDCINLRANSHLINTATIMAGGYSGVYTPGGGSITNGVTGTIEGGGAGIYVSYSTTIINKGNSVGTGLIKGNIGVYMGGFSGVTDEFTNKGWIQGAGGPGVNFDGGTDILITNDGGKITGNFGIWANVACKVVNTGTAPEGSIAGADSGIYLLNGGEVRNIGGVITGDNYGVYSVGDCVVNNQDDGSGLTVAAIIGTREWGVHVDGKAYVANDGGRISGAGGIAVTWLDMANDYYIINSGYVGSTSRDGILVNNGDAVIIVNNGEINASVYGIYAHAGTMIVIENTGEIKNSVTGILANVSDTAETVWITNFAAGEISGGNGIWVGGSCDDAYVVNYGTISVTSVGIGTEFYGSIENYGTVSGGTGVKLQGNAISRVYNLDGEISGGIEVSSGPTSLWNKALITGDVILVDNAAVVNFVELAVGSYIDGNFSIGSNPASMLVFSGDAATLQFATVTGTANIGKAEVKSIQAPAGFAGETLVLITANVLNGKPSNGSVMVGGIKMDLKVDGNNLIAVKAPLPYRDYTITATTFGNASISPAGKMTVPGGTNAKFTFSAAAGYFIGSVVVDGVDQPQSVIDRGYYTFYDVKSNHTIQVFSREPKTAMTLKINVAEGRGYAEYSLNGTTFTKYTMALTLSENTSVTIRAVAADGSEFVKWKDGNNEIHSSTTVINMGGRGAVTQVDLYFTGDDSSGSGTNYLMLYVPLIILGAMVAGVVYFLLRRPV